jgi:hypothetical protein
VATLHKSLSIQLSVEKNFVHVRLIDQTSLAPSTSPSLSKKRASFIHRPVSGVAGVLMGNPSDSEMLADLVWKGCSPGDRWANSSHSAGIEDLIHDVFDAWDQDNKVGTSLLY